MTYKITLSVGKDIITLETSSPITEERTANWTGYDLTHMPTDILAYKNTTGRHFGVQAKLVSRNPSEAAANARYVDLIRSWVLPDFGSSGATPPIVKLSAFYNNNITGVPCVIKNYSVTWPDDVDWIFATDQGIAQSVPTTDNIPATPPMPVIMIVSISLDEIYSPLQVTGKQWKMKLSPGGWFVFGTSATDVTGGAGAQTTASQNNATITPSLIDLSGDVNFSGLHTGSTKNVPKLSTTNPQNGNGINDIALQNVSNDSISSQQFNAYMIKKQQELNQIADQQAVGRDSLAYQQGFSQLQEEVAAYYKSKNSPLLTPTPTKTD